MPWELILVKYDGAPPKFREDSDESRQLAMGTLDEVRKHISDALPGIEWYEEPPLIEMMKANGSELWKDWDEQMIAWTSKPKLHAVYESGGTYLEMFGFEHEGPVKSILMEVRGNDNPIPTLHVLCAPKAWSVAEMGKDGQFLDLDGGASEQWDKWQEYLNVVSRQSVELHDSDT